MPAETHTNREAIDARDVVDLVDALVGTDDLRVDADDELAAVGLGDDAAVLEVWRAVAEELAERTIADLDVEEILLARTVGDLADAIVRALGVSEASDL